MSSSAGHLIPLYILVQGQNTSRGFHSRACSVSSAHRSPLMTAPSIVAGKPVAVQSPARKRFGIEVACAGRKPSASGEHEIVARFSRTHNELIACDGASEYTARRSSNAISTSWSFVMSTNLLAALMTHEMCPSARCSRPNFRLLKIHCTRRPMMPRNSCGIKSRSNQR